MLLVGASSAWAATPSTLYLTPNSNWKEANARFAAYFFGNGEKWVSMTKVANETDLYEVTVPSGYPSVIFCRMNPSATANNWDNKWNQTSDLTIPTNGTNHYTIKAGTWDKGGGTWATYNPYTYPSVSTISATVDGDNLVCKGKITSMGSATKVVWAFTVLSNENISKADADWKYPKDQNQITAANTEFTYNIPISSLSLTNGNTYYVRAMTVDLNKTGYSSGQYGNAVAGNAISFVYNPCITTDDVAPGTISVSPSAPHYAGTQMTLKLSNPTSVSGYNTSIQWLKKNGANYEVVSGETSNTLKLTLGEGAYAYKAKVTWTKGECEVPEETAEKTFTVKALPAPSIIMKETITVNEQSKEVPATYTTRKSGDNLQWRAHLKWSSNATYNTVMVVRYTHDATKTAPTNGTAYSVNSKIGAGTVVYNDFKANECDDYGIEVGGEYDYYLYTVNNNYYSVASDAVYLNPRYTVAPDANLGDTEHEWWTDYYYMTKNGNVWSYTFENKEAGEYSFQIADGYTWENGWFTYNHIDDSKGNLECTSHQNEAKTHTNIYFTTPTKGDITINYTENGGAYVTFTPDCITNADVNIGKIKTIAPLCQGSSFTLEFATAPSDVNTYTKTIEWQEKNGDGTFKTIATADTYEVTPSAGTHTYRAKVTWTCSWEEKGGTQKKCEFPDVTQPIEVTVYATSVVNLTESAKTICIGESFKLSDFVDNTTTVGTVTWREGTETGNVVAGDALLSPSQTTNYYATAKNGVCGDSGIKTLEVKVKQRPAANDFDYTIADVNYDGNPHSVAVTWKNGDSEGITVYYNGEQEAPSAVGEYAITVKTTAHGDLCETTEPVGLGTLKIVCPEVPVPTIGETSNTYACNGTITANGKVQITNYDSKYDYYLNGYTGKLTIVTEGEKHYVNFVWARTETYNLYAKSNCGTSGFSAPFEIKYINTQPSVTAISINPEFVCGSGEATIAVTGNDATSYKLYEKTGLYTFVKDFTGPTVTVDRTGTYAVKAINGSCIGTSLSSDVIFTINPIPNDPVLVNPDPICEGESFTLPEKDDNQKTITWVGVTNTTLTNLTAGEHTYTAKIVENGCSSNEVTYTVTVKTKPTVTNITVNNSTPVINEDVLLTVQGSNIASVDWAITEGSGELTDASGNSVKLTSNASGKVKVTATAKSDAGCSATYAKEVTFKAVDECISTTETIESKNIEIWCRETGNSKPGAKLTCYAWINGTSTKLCGETGSTTNTTKTSQIEGSQYTYRVWTIDMTNYANKTVNVIFKKGTDTWDGQTNDLTAGTRNNRYYFVYDSDNPKDNTKTKQTKSESLTTTTTTPAPVTAPAVKTVSATSVEGSGIVTFTGQIIKTGCAATSKIYYGYQFKKADEEWPTSGVQASNTPEEGKLIPLTNASATALGYEFTTNIQGLAKGDYHFRAYIINGYEFTNGNYDQGVYYGLDKLVTVSTVKIPVSEAKIYYSTMGGEIIEEPNTICKGSMAYIKLSYQGSQLDEIEWLVDDVVVENKIEQTSFTDLFVFTVSGTEKISARLKNAENTDWVTTDELEYTMAPEPVSPTISLDRGTICSGETASLVLSSVKVGQSYQLFKQIENDGVYTDERVGDVTLVCTVDNEELKFTGLNESGKYLVKAYNAECTNLLVPSQTATLDVINSADLKISIVPTATETTPWMPVKLTVEASGDYTITSTPNDAVINKISNDTYKVKLPLPEEADKGEDNTVNNVTFTPRNYEIEATLVSVTGEAQQCAKSAKSTITLKQYIEPCTQK